MTRRRRHPTLGGNVSNDPEWESLCAAYELAEKAAAAAFKNPQSRPDDEADAFAALEAASERLVEEFERMREYFGMPPSKLAP
jgi:hypothetical protein